ncbi:hypothetical protein H5410_022905 [Solanum commersonii]|uniref:Histone H4 n=1 Tax=Solanum commersonii TaxID=4109 RepID=A0A9J5ZID9_SOLCO|nr:hypothetical protein H5410_022905 [Solanum commersonii]
MSGMEMKMLRWTGSHTRLDKIRNNRIHKKVQVAHIESKIRGHLRWHVYVLHRTSNPPVCRYVVRESSKKGRDGLTEVIWLVRIPIADLNLLGTESKIMERFSWGKEENGGMNQREIRQGKDEVGEDDKVGGDSGGAQIFLENVICDVVTYTEHAHRKRVTAMDVVGMLSRDRTGLLWFWVLRGGLVLSFDVSAKVLLSRKEEQLC